MPLLLPAALLLFELLPLLLLLLVNESNCFWKKSCARANKPVGLAPEDPSLEGNPDDVDDVVDGEGSDLDCVTVCFMPPLLLLLFLVLPAPCCV